MRASYIKKRDNRISRSLAGFTLSEALIATLILMLATSLISQALVVGYRQFFLRTQRSEAELLLASLQTAIQEELTYATDIKADGDTLTFTSYRAGANSTITESKGKIVLNGKILDDDTKGRYANGFGLVSTGSYEVEKGFKWGGSTLSLSAQLDAEGSASGITYDGTNKVFTVPLSIYSSEDGTSPEGDAIVSSTFLVYPINP